MLDENQNHDQHQNQDAQDDSHTNCNACEKNISVQLVIWQYTLRKIYEYHITEE